MHARTLALSLAPLFAASLFNAQAHAQAPGAAPQVAAAEPVACTCGGRESVMANRWAVGLSVGSMALASEGAPDDDTGFAIGELAVRFRATPHLELELSAGGGREQTADHEQGELAVGTVALAARYRFRPEAAWNWFVMGGLGGASVTRHDATEEERSDATQPIAMLGVGVERRFHHLALQAELRAVGLGERDQGGEVMVAAPEAAVMAPAASVSEARSGGLVTIGASYYF